eukprot:gene15919-11391_t
MAMHAIVETKDLFNRDARLSAKSLQPFQRPIWKPRPKGVNRFLLLRKWWEVLKKALVGVWNDLFPAQRHLWCLRVTFDDNNHGDGPLASTTSSSSKGSGGWYATLMRL